MAGFAVSFGAGLSPGLQGSTLPAAQRLKQGCQWQVATIPAAAPGGSTVPVGSLVVTGVCVALWSSSRSPRRLRLKAAQKASKSDQQRILVVGGGLGGLNLALRLADMPWSGAAENRKVTLVDPKDRFVFSPLLIDYAVCGVIELDEFAPRFANLLEETKGVEHLQGSVSAVDFRRRKATVETSPAGGSGSEALTMEFDAIALAPGVLGGGRPPPELRGLKEAVAAGRAQGFQSLADAQQLRERLAAGVKSVAIVGAGYVGVELASALAEALPGAAASGDIVLFGGEFMRGAEDANVRRCTERLEDLGVVQRRGRVTSLEDSGLSWSPTPDDKPQSHMCDLVIVTGPLAAAIQFPGLIPPSPIGSASEEAALAGRAVTDPFLRAAPGVFCLGDAASAGTPPTGQAAMQQADVAAWNIFTQLSKLPRLTWRQYKPSALGEFVSLGRSDAAGVVQPAQLGKLLPPALPPALAKAVSKLLDSGNVDLVGNVDLGGAPAALLRRLAYLYRMPTIGHRLRVAQQWLERGGGVLPGV